MTANSRRARSIYIFWWASQYANYSNTGIYIFESSTFQHNEDEIGGVPYYEGHYIRPVWGGKDLIYLPHLSISQNFHRRKPLTRSRTRD